MTAAEVSFAQSPQNLLDRYDGKYAGTIARRVTGSFDLQAGIAKDERVTKEVLEAREREAKAILRSDLPDKPIPVQLSVVSANESWTIELGNSDDQGTILLPSLVVLRLPKVPTPLSPAEIDAVPSETWAAWGAHRRDSLTLYFVERNSLSTPIQLQIALQPVGNDISFILWRIDKDGRRGAAWTGMLVREGK